MGPERGYAPVHVRNKIFLRLPGERKMTRFQRVLLFSAGCGVVAIGIAYLIVVVLR